PGDLTIDDVQDFIEHSLARDEARVAEIKSAQARTAHLQSLSRWAFVAATAVVAIAAGVVALIQWYNNQRLFLSAFVRDQVAAARGNDTLEDDDPSLAILFALDLLRQKERYGHATEALAYKALQTPQPKAILLTEASFPTATFSPDGRLLLISKGNAFQLWDTDKITPVGKEFIPKGIDARWRTIWSHDAQWLIGSNANKETVLFRPCSVDKLREYFQRCDNDVDFIRTIHVGDGTASWPSVL